MKSLQPIACCGAWIAAWVVNQTQHATANMTARRIHRHGEQKASAAAEGMRSSRPFSIEGLLFDASFLPVHVP
jgi:hypothetical protein